MHKTNILFDKVFLGRNSDLLSAFFLKLSNQLSTVSPEMEMATQLKNRKKNPRKPHSSNTVLDWAISFEHLGK